MGSESEVMMLAFQASRWGNKDHRASKVLQLPKTSLRRQKSSGLTEVIETRSQVNPDSLPVACLLKAACLCLCVHSRTVGVAELWPCSEVCWGREGWQVSSVGLGKSLASVSVLARNQSTTEQCPGSVSMSALLSTWGSVVSQTRRSLLPWGITSGTVWVGCTLAQWLEGHRYCGRKLHSTRMVFLKYLLHHLLDLLSPDAVWISPAVSYQRLKNTGAAMMKTI